MQTRILGRDGPRVAAIGLGCMSLGLGDIYSSGARDEAGAVRLIRRALDLGVTMLDTANIYGDSEAKVGKALKGRRENVVVATKFGIVSDSDVPVAREGVNGRPEYVRQQCETSLRRLGLDHIDLYYQHRIDPATPIEETVGAMSDLVREGKLRWLGLSEAAPETIRRAQAVHPIAAVQSEYSLWSREPEDALLPTLRELGIALVAYSPLGRGFLAGRFQSADDLATADWRRGNPRFQSENFDKNLFLADALRELALLKSAAMDGGFLTSALKDERKSTVTPAQLLLAWVLAQGSDIVPIPGTSSSARLEENIAAAAVEPTSEDLARIEAALPKDAASGARYHDEGMRLVNH